ncbi:HNH endonuclease [Enterobacter cloacae complex sp. P6RS]|uniref:HNH endonuclease signature motif containing protein n=1 Tax=unclassified Enterobacter cloacae complex TaxID=2757714 RepID=UPI0018757169|nr:MULTISPECIES: HNH endonuclease signature motif containing protein [unclassified Enterobacter cloacae complex]MBE4915522.1 HNH endonuclease [Enterobacter cloacae complex sp. P4RS]MBE4990993.1 HNH endonuclease [Enterobacter cloacae complex sp. P6RS]
MHDFRLFMIWDAARELKPEDFQYILRPEVTFERARIYYDLDSDNYSYFSLHQMPNRKSGFVNPHSAKYDRKRNGLYDGAYDHTQHNIDTGWLIGIDTTEKWDYFKHPFYFDEKGDLVYDCFMEHWHSWFEMKVKEAYEKCLNDHQGRKPAPTQKIHYSDAPIQHAQSAKTINSKAAGRLLAAGGVYNGNIEGFRKTAEQLGGEAIQGYDQVLNEQTAGTAIAASSILLAKRPNSKSFEEVYRYLGKVRGKTKLLNNIEVKEINYVKRDPSETMFLRKEFNNIVRKKFLNQLSNSSDAANVFEPSDLFKMSKGTAPDGWEVHHKLPLDDGGTNAFDNLSLVEKEPFHKVLTNMQRTSTRGMLPGESKVTPWVMPTGSIYPLK